MEMVKIAMCNVSSCSYNKDGHCHTFGINVGPHSECNTFIVANARGGLLSSSGGVGACIATDCEFNQKMSCAAANIRAEMHNMHADCATYRKKM